MTRNEAAYYALDALKKLGAEKVACRVSSERKDEFNVEANKFSLMRTLFDATLSIKAIKEDRKGVAIINKLDKASIDKAVSDCIALAASAVPDEAEDIAEKIENKSFDQSLNSSTAGAASSGADMDQLFSRSKEFLQQIKDQYPKIVLESMTSDYNSEQIVYINSNGVEFNVNKEFYQIGTMFSAKDGEKSSSFNGYGARLTSLKKPFMDLDMHRTVLAEAEQSLEPRMVDEKFTGQVIVTPACDDMIWQTIIECFLCDTSLIQGTSRWKDALNTKVADSKLTMRAAPLDSGVIAGERFTSDGYESRNFDIIKDGVLKSFALSLYGSKKTGKPRALNTAFINLDVAAGNTPLDEIIKNTECGILLNRFSGASPGPSGDISGVAKNSFLIEKGKITGALKETMVSFNIVDALQNISAISKERCQNGWSILPWCCFDGVTISSAQ